MNYLLNVIALPLMLWPISVTAGIYFAVDFFVGNMYISGGISVVLFVIMCMYKKDIEEIAKDSW